MDEAIRGKVFDWDYALYPDSHIVASCDTHCDGVYLYLYLPGTTYGDENGSVYIKPIGCNLLKLSLYRATNMHAVMLECLRILNKTCVTHSELKLSDSK